MADLPRIVVVGSSFAGDKSAPRLAKLLRVGSRDPGAEITVISNTEIFTFIPSLIRVYAAGVAVAVAPAAKTPVPRGVPRTGYLTEGMARVAAHNIAADIRGDEPIHLPFAGIDAKCILDAGNTGVLMTSDAILEPRKHAWMIPGPEAHWAKLAFEKFFMATHRRGYA